MDRGESRPIVDAETCNGCELCVQDCPPMVFDLVDDKAVVARGDWCIGCGHCAALCPSASISHVALAGEDAPRPAKKPAVVPDELQLLLRERRSIRAYKDRPVEREVLERIIEAGRYAPTGSNSENVRYVVLAEPEAIEGLRSRVIRFYEKLFGRLANPVGRFAVSMVAGRERVQRLNSEYRPLLEAAQERMKRGEDRLLYDAKAVFVTHAEVNDTSSAFNCAVALYNCSLMAHSLGVGCCFNGFVESAVNHSPELRAYLELPKGHRCFGAMGMGWQKVRYRTLVERKPAQVRWR